MIAQQYNRKPLTHPYPQVPGTVVRTGMLKMLEHSRRYRCGKCGLEKEVAIDVEMRSATLAPPSFCGGAGAGPDGFCGGKSFSKVEGSEVCRDYQEIKIQEQVQHLGIGSMPRGIMVLLHDDLVDTCKPGDDVRITGVPLRRWKPLMKGTRADAELVIVCNAVDVAHDKGSSSCAIRYLCLFPQYIFSRLFVCVFERLSRATSINPLTALPP